MTAIFIMFVFAFILVLILLFGDLTIEQAGAIQTYGVSVMGLFTVGVLIYEGLKL